MCDFPCVRKRFVVQKCKSWSIVILPRKAKMTLMLNEPFVAKTKILTRHQNQKRGQSRTRGGKPGPGAQPHALFTSRGRNLKKFEVCNMTSTGKKYFKCHGKYFLKEAFFAGAKLSPPLLPERYFAGGINEQASHFWKTCTGLLWEADSEQNVALTITSMRFLVRIEDYNK